MAPPLGHGGDREGGNISLGLSQGNIQARIYGLTLTISLPSVLVQGDSIIHYCNLEVIKLMCSL